MPGIAISVLMLVVVAAVIGVCLAIGAPWLAVPIVFLILVVWGGARVAAARDSRTIELTDEERRTLTPESAKPGPRGGTERPEPAA